MARSDRTAILAGAFHPMSSYADREIIVSGTMLAAIAIFVGGVVQFTHRGALNHFFGFALVTTGVVLLFMAYLARYRRRTGTQLLTVMMVVAGLLLVGTLFKDAIERVL